MDIVRSMVGLRSTLPVQSGAEESCWALTRDERLIQDGAVDPILFYKPWDEWGCFSNFSRHEFILPSPFTGDLVVYSTGEHRYQAMKATTQEEHDYVVEAPNPSVAKDRGREVNLREGWGNSRYDLCWYVMMEVVSTKTFQNRDVFDALADTYGRFIYEDSPVDDIRPDGDSNSLS
jgi:ribA/ribD-fused uncharacterized protein